MKDQLDRCLSVLSHYLILIHDSTMANKALIPFLVTMMLVTGVCNTILNKYQVGLNLFYLAFMEVVNPWKGHAMRPKLRFPRSQGAPHVRAACDSDVGPAIL